MSGARQVSPPTLSLATESVFLESICSTRPIGLHKHFRMIQILKAVNNTQNTGLASPHYISAAQLWSTLDGMYDLTSLDAVSNEWAFAFPPTPTDFSLPSDFSVPSIHVSPPPPVADAKKRRLSSASPTSNTSSLSTAAPTPASSVFADETDDTDKLVTAKKRGRPKADRSASDASASAASARKASLAHQRSKKDRVEEDDDESSEEVVSATSTTRRTRGRK
ncbi:hypothetical protein HDU79_006324 [Rhizoclosmatium sp. JEL0117]|nr:hypothetical protein HDU79_006324 [Rhizoclosmatium sp. JEL0117]